MADNLEGIAGWRLLDRIVRTRVTDTDHALSWLVAEGYLDRSAGAAAPPVYRLNPGRLAEARRLVGSRIHTKRAVAKRRRRT
jgi:hypothetical protein